MAREDDRRVIRGNGQLPLITGRLSCENGARGGVETGNPLYHPLTYSMSVPSTMRARSGDLERLTVPVSLSQRG